MEFFALSIRVAKIFDWGGGSKAKITSNDVISKILERLTFRGIKIFWIGR